VPLPLSVAPLKFLVHAALCCFGGRDPTALAEMSKKHALEIEVFITLQFLFDKQWKAVKVRRFGFTKPLTLKAVKVDA
jgi:hypothetical protein